MSNLLNRKLLVNVDELWLKGKNRKIYFQTMMRNIRSLLKAMGIREFSLRNENQRLMLDLGESSERWKEVTDSLIKTPGIHSIIPSICCPKNLDATSEALLNELEKEELPKTFKVEASRSDKHFELDSMQIKREIGARVLKHFDPKLKVDVHKPEMQINIKVLRTGIYFSFKTYYAIGGLPWGTSGHLVTLLSGGFDSPVASFLMAKRGCKQTFVFFHAYPFVGHEVKEKIIEITKVLATYQTVCDLYVVPFGNIQKEIGKTAREEYRTIFFRKLMVECSNEIARRVKGQALLTGDSLGQVSSQTIENISLIDSFSTLPIFRPLIGFNKSDVIKKAEEIGTAEISKVPHDDACSLFAPKFPIIRPKKFYYQHYFEQNNFTDLVSDSIDKSEIISFDCTGSVKFRKS